MILPKNTTEQLVSPRTKQPLNKYQQFLLQNSLKSPVPYKGELQIKLQKKREQQQQQLEQPESPQKIMRTSVQSRPSNQKIQDVDPVQKIADSLKCTVLETQLGTEITSVIEHESNAESELDKFLNKTYSIENIITIQSIWRARRPRKQLILLRKKYRYRACVIKELIQTEKSYLDNLTLVIDKALKPLTIAKIISSKDIVSIFKNIDAIQQLSKDFLGIIEQKFKDFGPNTLIANELVATISYFKIYFEYVSNYNNAFKRISELRKTDAQFKIYIEQLTHYSKLGSQLENFLIQPVQRLPRYVLLFKDLLKNTPETHRDYKNIQKALSIFEQVNEQNNTQMDKIIVNSRLFELQKLYGDQIKIVEANREFKREESIQVYFQQDKEVRPAIVYFLSDLVLITERVEKQQPKNNQRTMAYVLRSHIQLNSDSLCRELPDMQNYTSLFQVTGQNAAVTFIANNQATQVELVDCLNELIVQIQEKRNDRMTAYQKNELEFSQDTNKQLVQLDILGTQEIIGSNKQQFTQYIIQIEIQNITQKLFIRFKQFKKLQEAVKQQFPTLQFPYFKDDAWINKTKAIVIEQRKIAMLNFLQTVLSSPDVQKQPAQVLSVLGLPDNFYQLPMLLEQQTQTMADTSALQAMRTIRKPMSQHHEGIETILSANAQQLRQAFRKESYMQDQFTPRGPIKATQIYQKKSTLLINENSSTQQSHQSDKRKPQRANSLMTSRKISASKLLHIDNLNNNSKRNSIIEQKPIEISSVEIQVMTFSYPKSENHKFTIQPETKAIELLEEVAGRINLQSAFDFKLYLLDKQGIQPLDDDEQLWHWVVQNDDSSFMKGIFQKGKQKAVYNGKIIQLRKHLFLPKDQEKQMLTDLRRVELMSQQLLNDIQTFKLKLHLKEYPQVSALYLYILGYTNITEQNIPFHILKEFVPQTAFKRIPMNDWINFMPVSVDMFNLQITGLMEEQDKKLLDDKQQHESSDCHLTGSDRSEQPQDKYRKQHIAQLVLLDVVFATLFYGLHCFDATPNKETFPDIELLGRKYWTNKLSKLDKSAQNQEYQTCKLNQQVLLCIGYDGLFIFQGYGATQELLKLDYDEFQSINIYTQSITLSIKLLYGNSTDFTIDKTYDLKFSADKSYQIRALLNEYSIIRSELQQELLMCEEQVEI